MMRFKTTWIFLVLLVAIASYYFLIEEKRRGAEERERKAWKKILTYGRDDVYRIILVNPRGDRIELEKAESGWMIVSPVIAEAAQSTIDVFLMQLVPGHKTDYFPGVTDLEIYGLEEPFATVIFFAQNREHPDTIYVGDKTPTSTSCYIRLGTNDTVIVSQEMTHNVMNKSLYHLREKNFVNFSSSAIDSFHITGEEYAIKLIRRGGLWWLDKPPGRADNQMVEGYLNNLTSALIRGFPSEDKSELGRFGLEKPSRRIALRYGGREMEIGFGDLDEDLVYVVRTDLAHVIQLEQKLLEVFRWKRNDLRARNLSFFEIGDIGEIRYETPDTTIVLEKHPDGWRAGDRPVRQGKVETFLGRLKRIQFDAFLDEGISDVPTPPEQFSIRVTLLDSMGTLVDRIVFRDSKGPREEGASLSANARGRIEPGRTADLRLLIEGH
jgi:hypothetical protein